MHTVEAGLRLQDSLGHSQEGHRCRVCDPEILEASDEGKNAKSGGICGEIAGTGKGERSTKGVMARGRRCGSLDIVDWGSLIRLTPCRASKLIKMDEIKDYADRL